MKRSIALGYVLVVGFASYSLAAPGDPAVTFEKRSDGLAIAIGGKPFALYVFEDSSTTHPYFKDLHAPGGMSVTRNHPPKQDDPADHATMHPGLWMAFGDISGADFWRNKDRVRHIGFDEKPSGGAGIGEFAVKNRYEKGGKPIAEELARYRIMVRPEGYLLVWDSTFMPVGQALIFGDQEEMGLGIRMATPLTVKQGGMIVNSNGLKNEAQVRGKLADWCVYEGPIESNGERTGVVLMAHSETFPRSWWHARDYGLLVANPFGRNAFNGGPKSEVRIEPGVVLRLRFGVLVFQGTPDINAAYKDYLEQGR